MDFFQAHPRPTELVPGRRAQEPMFEHLYQMGFMGTEVWEASV